MCCQGVHWEPPPQAFCVEACAGGSGDEKIISPLSPKADYGEDGGLQSRSREWSNISNTQQTTTGQLSGARVATEHISPQPFPIPPFRELRLFPVGKRPTAAALSDQSELCPTAKWLGHREGCPHTP